MEEFITYRNTLLLVATLSFISYGWSIIGVFKTVEKQKNKEYNILKFSNMAIWFESLYCIWITAEYNPYFYFSGLTIAIMTLALFWYTAHFTKKAKLSLAFSEDSPQFIFKSGPYRFVRHPFYTAYLFNYVAYWVATQQHVLLIFIMLIVAIYFRAIEMEEGKFSESNFSEDYALYKNQTGAIFPRLMRKK